MVTGFPYDITPDDVDIAVRAERDRLLARIEALHRTWSSNADDWGACGHEWVRLDELAAFVAEERAR